MEKVEKMLDSIVHIEKWSRGPMRYLADPALRHGLASAGILENKKSKNEVPTHVPVAVRYTLVMPSRSDMPRLFNAFKAKLRITRNQELKKSEFGLSLPGKGYRIYLRQGSGNRAIIMVVHAKPIGEVSGAIKKALKLYANGEKITHLSCVLNRSQNNVVPPTPWADQVPIIPPRSVSAILGGKAKSSWRKESSHYR